MADANKIAVTCDSELEDLVPVYLQTKQKDIQSILDALSKGDYDTIRLLGHSMKGSGGGYGFQQITEIGRVIEQAAKDKNDGEIKRQTEELSSYLQRVEVVYQ